MATTPESETATATKTDTKLTLDAPDPVPTVSAEKAAGLVPVSPEKQAQHNEKVSTFVDELVSLDANSPDFGAKVDQIAAMGQKEIRDAAGQSNRFLDRPVRSMDENSAIGTDLSELRRTVEDLDPGSRGNLTGKRRLFGIIPWGNKLRAYFDSYKSAQNHIAAILKRLASGKDELIKDNAAIAVERQKLWDAMGRLEEMIFVAKALDSALEEKAVALESTDPEKSKAIKETALFYVRQRTQDLLTQMAVSVQGYLALDLVKKNNVELIKGVDRASTTTVGALRTAVTVAQAMTNQRLVLNQITALNETTANMIDTTGEMLKSQTGEIHKQAAASTIPLETLQRAFQNIYDTMDEIDRFKLEALGSMKQTVNVLSDEVEKSKGYIARAEGAEQSQTRSTPFEALEG